MSTEPAREEAWNCNRCRDRRTVVWNGVETPCDRCGRLVIPAGSVEVGDTIQLVARVGSPALPQGTEATAGGADAERPGGHSHDYACPNCRASFSLPLGMTCDDHHPEPILGPSCPCEAS